MQKFTVHSGQAAPLRRSNVDTDQIIPVRFMTRPTARGLADALFHDWRKDDDFILSQPAFRAATVLIAGQDFGTGSSREGAVWALQDYGFRAVIAPRFGDIFRGNALQRGLLAVVLPLAAVTSLWELVEGAPDAAVTIDLTERVVRAGEATYAFELEDYTRWRLLNGLDDTALALSRVDAIEAYEGSRRSALPRTGRIRCGERSVGQ